MERSSKKKKNPHIHRQKYGDYQRERGGEREARGGTGGTSGDGRSLAMVNTIYM